MRVTESFVLNTFKQTMTTKAEKDRQKQIQEKCQALLTQMLRDEDNKYCVDCDAKGKFKWKQLGIVKIPDTYKLLNVVR